ncbi:MAG: T9SS type A sorting domain-containing protein [Bacteroidia bacterium]|nr:T9SS type A sorting domain-containing protein [Bacteroidia bacterium]
MKNLKLIITLFAFLNICNIKAQTWTENIAPILYSNCTKCHNSNGIANFPLITYSDAFNKKGSIKDQVEQGIMPPWPPDHDYRDFSHERLLSESDKKSIIDWVINGAPQGDISKAPTPPVYKKGATINSPDMILRMPTYTINTSSDLYQCFVMPSNLSLSKFLSDIEVLPGNSSVVHHVLVFQDTALTCQMLDNATPEPGYTNFGGVGSNSAELIATWVPGGASLYHFPTGLGIKINKNAFIIIQVHYPAGIINKQDSTKVFLKFSPSNSLRQITIAPVLDHDATLTNGPLFIQANTTKTFNAEFNVPIDASLLFIGPHMHLIGKKIKVWAVTASKDTIPLIKIDNWDFHWQGMYTFNNLIKIPAGSTLYSEAFYDNTASNPEQPNNPPKDVVKGEKTTDEMMLVYFAFTPYQLGDESITVGLKTAPNSGIVSTPQLYEPYPNPSDKSFSVDFYLNSQEFASFEISDINGRIISSDNKFYNAGNQHIDLQTEGFSKGIYTLIFKTGSYSKTKKLIIE